MPRYLCDRWALRRHQQRLYMMAGNHPIEYHQYLDEQITRTIRKRDQPLQLRTSQFIDQLAELVPLHDMQVLCVGCRNHAELDYFFSKGAKQVIGIDLFSESPLIQVMDMHSLTFPNSAFDLVYACHSLEHAYAPTQVAAEILRVLKPGGVVAVEVPIHFEPRGSDRIDYGNQSGLLSYFMPNIGRLILTEEGASNNAVDAERNEFIRVVFTTGSQV